MPTNNISLEEIVQRLEKLEMIEHKNVLELPQVPAINMTDTLMLVTETDLTGRASVEAFMQYLNENLKNFICWKPVVTNNTLTWERSSNDQSPGIVNFSVIIFPMASETTNGMVTSEFFKKVQSIDEANIVYKTLLSEELAKKAPLVHTHDQYQLTSEMPTKLSEFDNDTNFITFEDIPKNLSSYTNDSKFISAETAPIVSDENNGFMTSELFSSLNQIAGDYVTSQELSDAISSFSGTLPTTVSAFENDVGYVAESDLHSKFGELGSINLLSDSRFEMVGTTDSEWRTTGDAVLTKYEEDPDYEYVGKVNLIYGSSLVNTIKHTLGDYYVISFLAKASSAAGIIITFGGISKILSVTNSWMKYSFVVSRKTSDSSKDLVISTLSDTEFDFYITNVKVERGRLGTDFSLSTDDVVRKASADNFGIMKPDNFTIVVDPDTGRTKVNVSSIAVGAMIYDEAPGAETTYSGNNIEAKLSGKADLQDGKVPSSQLPSYVDDVIEGVMSADNTVFTIDPDQNSSGDPSKGKIYLDRVTNIGYRWTGSGYMSIGEKYVHPTTSGFNHIPAGGISGQVVGW